MEEFENMHDKPMSVKDWLITFLILAIPVVGFIMLFVYAFGSDQNVNRQNWAKAQLIMAAIMIVLITLFFLAFGALFMAAMAGNMS